MRQVSAFNPDASRESGIMGPLVWCVAQDSEVKNAGDKLHKLASVIPLDNVGIYRQLLSQWPDAYRAVPGANDPYITSILHDRGGDRIEYFPRWMRYLDTLNYLPNDILTKVDRASMAVSLEVRCPLIDQRIIEFSWSLSNDQLIRKGKTKWILRQIICTALSSRDV